MRSGHIILDRDGVLNVEPEEGWLQSPAEWRWEQGAEAGLELLASSGVAVSVATNQSGVGRGVVRPEDLAQLHRWLEADLVARGVLLVGIFTCTHAPDHGCGCRKPRPGLVQQAMERSGIPAERTALIGDAERDLDAAAASGIDAVVVRTGKARTAAPHGVASFADLASAVDHLVACWSELPDR